MVFGFMATVQENQFSINILYYMGVFYWNAYVLMFFPTEIPSFILDFIVMGALGSNTRVPITIQMDFSETLYSGIHDMCSFFMSPSQNSSLALYFKFGKKTVLTFNLTYHNFLQP